MVMFPDIQYLCTMSNFVYDMNSKVMEMEQKGESSFTLLTPQELLELTKDQYDEPTFFSTNVNNDTISFFSSKGRYYVDREIIEADNINYIPIADALIQPGDGKITINRRAKIEKIDNALVAINNKTYHTYRLQSPLNRQRNIPVEVFMITLMKREASNRYHSRR